MHLTALPRPKLDHARQAHPRRGALACLWWVATTSWAHKLTPLSPRTMGRDRSCRNRLNAAWILCGIMRSGTIKKYAEIRGRFSVEKRVGTFFRENFLPPNLWSERNRTIKKSNDDAVMENKTFFYRSQRSPMLLIDWEICLELFPRQILKWKSQWKFSNCNKNWNCCAPLPRDFSFYLLGIPQKGSTGESFFHFLDFFLKISCFWFDFL